MNELNKLLLFILAMKLVAERDKYMTDKEQNTPPVTPMAVGDDRMYRLYVQVLASLRKQMTGMTISLVALCAVLAYDRSSMRGETAAMGKEIMLLQHAVRNLRCEVATGFGNKPVQQRYVDVKAHVRTDIPVTGEVLCTAHADTLGTTVDIGWRYAKRDCSNINAINVYSGVHVNSDGLTSQEALFVDGVNNRIGIGTAAPSSAISLCDGYKQWWVEATEDSYVTYTCY